MKNYWFAMFFLVVIAMQLKGTLDAKGLESRFISIDQRQKTLEERIDIGSSNLSWLCKMHCGYNCSIYCCFTLCLGI